MSLFGQLHQHANAEGSIKLPHPHPSSAQETTTSPTETTATPTEDQSSEGTDSSTSTTSSAMTDTLLPGGVSSTVSETTPISSSSPSPSPSPGSIFFPTSWDLPDFALNSPTPSSVQWVVDQAANLSSPALYLCQTNLSIGVEPTSQDTWSVAKVAPTCNNSSACPFDMNAGRVSISFTPGAAGTSGTAQLPLSNFFFCFGNDPGEFINELVCNSFSDKFSIGPVNQKRGLGPRQEQAGQTLSTASLMPTIALPVSLYTPAVSIPGAQPLTTGTPITTTSITSLTTITTPTGTTTGVTVTSKPTSTSTLASSTTPSHSKALSTGAKVGIALGALIGVAAILLLALFFLRRKHRQRSPPPEQVMLTRDLHTDSFGRNALITEKETNANHNTNNLPTPIDDTLPIQRHSALSPYDSIPTAPYSGPASGVPRRKPTAASAVSRISGPVSPRSVSISASSPSEEFEEYHDIPVYGDARHSPRVYSVEDRGTGVKAPFLSEEGMTAEEVARLEEEERRIDAAIAEAERNR